MEGRAIVAKDEGCGDLYEVERTPAYHRVTTLETTVVIPYLDAARAASIPDARDWSWTMAADPDT